MGAVSSNPRCLDNTAIYIGGDFTSPLPYACNSASSDDLATFLWGYTTPPGPVRAIEYMDPLSTVVVGGNGFLQFDGVDAVMPQGFTPVVNGLYMTPSPLEYLYVAGDNTYDSSYVGYIVKTYKAQPKSVVINFTFYIRPDPTPGPVFLPLESYGNINLVEYSSISFVASYKSNAWLLTSNQGATYY